MIFAHIQPIYRPKQSTYFAELYDNLRQNITVIASLTNMTFTINLQNYNLLSNKI